MAPRSQSANGWNLTIGALVLLLIAGAGFWLVATPRTGSHLGWALACFSQWLERGYCLSLLDPFLLPGMAVILCLEWLLPANPSQRIFSTGLAHDFTWVILEGVIRVSLLGIFVAFLSQSYDRYLKFMTVHPLAEWPAWARFIGAFLVGDLVAWVRHWVRHKIPWFWHFHAVHHSQPEINAFTVLRNHPVDHIVSQTITVVPFLMLNFSAPSIFLVTAFSVWAGRLQHSNIRTNLGPLRYLLVTPQSHRVHHSIEPRHFDKNFGALFSIWDRLFGTHYWGEDEYPQTGIADHDFPLERTGSAWSMLRTPILQLGYPFVRIGRDLWRWRRKTETPAENRDALPKAA